MLAEFSVQKARRVVPLLLVLWLAACGEPEARAARSASPDSTVAVTDDTGSEVRLPRPARRIVSLIPSANETLLALGVGDRIVGRTRYDREAALDTLPSVGGGLDPSLEVLLALRPELVVAWEGERSRGLRPRLAEMGIPVFGLAADDTADVFRSIRQLGVLSGTEHAADSLAASIRAELAAVRASIQGRPAPSVFYVVWDDPPMTAGPNTFIGQLIEVAGGRNVFPDAPSDWPNVSLEEVVRRQPEYVVFAKGEGTTRSLEALRVAPGWRELRAVREGRVIWLPARLMERPGPQIGRAARALRDALHPEIARR